MDLDGLKGIVIRDDNPKFVRRVTTESIKSDKNKVEIDILESIN